jgi:hypothetical protein
VLSDSHRLAARDYARAEDLVAETFSHWRGLDDGVDGPEVADLAELISLFRIGRVIAVLLRSLITPAPPGVVCAEMADAEPNRLVSPQARRPPKCCRRPHRRRPGIGSHPPPETVASDTAASPA